MPGTAFEFTATVVDPDGGSPVFTWTVNGKVQEGMTGRTYALYVPQVREALGAYSVDVTVSDRRGGTASARQIVRALLPDRWGAIAGAGDLCTRVDGTRPTRLLARSGPRPEPRMEILFSLQVYDSLAVEILGAPVTWRASDPSLLSVAQLPGSDDYGMRPTGVVGEPWVVGISGEAVDSMRVRIVHDVLAECS